MSNHQVKLEPLFDSGEKPFSCSHCNAAFGVRAHLQRHTKEKHSDMGKKYQCGVCVEDGKDYRVYQRGNMRVTIMMKIMSFFIEPTCAYARWAHMHCILSVCLSVCL